MTGPATISASFPAICGNTAFHPITDNLYAAFSQGVEMLYLFAFAFGRHSAAAMVHFTFLLALVWQIYAWCAAAGISAGRDRARPRSCSSVRLSGSTGPALTTTSRSRRSRSPCFMFWSFGAKTARRACWSAAGLLAGFAFAAKYTAFLAVPYAIGFVLWKTRRLRTGIAVAACASIGVLPWLLKNYLWFQNPLAPFFNQYFPKSVHYVSHSKANIGRLCSFTTPQPLGNPPSGDHLWVARRAARVRCSCCAPIALAGAPMPAGRGTCCSPPLVFGATYFSNISTRFLIPALPFMSRGDVPRAESRFPGLRSRLLVLHAVLSWPSVVRRYCHPDAWRLVKVPYREALRIKPEEGFLESNLPLYGVTRLIDRATPRGCDRLHRGADPGGVHVARRSW